jgi:hypothetical protein
LGKKRLGTTRRRESARPRNANENSVTIPSLWVLF